MRKWQVFEVEVFLSAESLDNHPPSLAQLKILSQHFHQILTTIMKPFLASEEQHPESSLVGTDLPLYFHVLTDIHSVTPSLSVSPSMSLGRAQTEATRSVSRRTYSSYLHL